MAAADSSAQQASFVIVTGPSRGGKSRWAESLVADFAEVVYVATSASRPDDSNWQERIRQHRDRRPAHWRLVESGPDLAAHLLTLAPGSAEQAVLIDALGGFVAAHLDRDSRQWNDACDGLCDAIAGMHQFRVLVIEETGWGLVPPTAIGGLFRDRLGLLAERLNTLADDSWLVIQGRALNLHQLGQPVP